MLPRVAESRVRPKRCRSQVYRAVAGGCLLFLVILGLPFLAVPPSVSSHPGSSFHLASQNSSGNPYGLCPSSGPVYFGIDWNCVAVLNLTMVVLMLGGIGIIAYVFRDADAAELPGDSAEIPLTEEEWSEVQARRGELLARKDNPGRSERSDR